LQRRYNREQRRYETTYSEISVGCEACHGPAAAHVTQAKATPRAQFDEQKGFARSFSPQAERQWLFLEGKPIAQLVAGPKDSKASKVDAEALGAERATELSACAKCHALRGDLGGDSLEFDQRYRVELLEDVHYFADGQIQGEVYEHGSFLQSKMHAAGVSCSDCHEPHGGTLRAQGNQLCGRCHSAETFDTPKHHFHMGKGEATQCVSCHMPSRVYMGVDDRRDHRLGVPRPDLTLEIGVPNACTTACHTQPDGRRAALWAAGEIEKHFGKERPPSFARAIDAARRVAPGADRLLTEVINQRDFPAIARATALLELRNFPSEEPLLWEGYSKDESPLVRRALAQLVAGWPAPDRVPVARALLGDPVRTVRLEAVRGLLDGPRTGFSAAEEARFIQVRQELKDSLLANADQPGALLDLARMRLLEVGSVEGATKPDAEVEGLFREALALDPAFTPVYINFADYYRVTGRDDHAEVLLKTGIEQVSDPAQLEHALGLVLVRLNRPDAALAHLRRAHDLRPELPRFGFVYAVALFEQGKQRDAIAVLEKLHSRFEGELQVLDALIQYQRVVGNEARAAELLQKMPGAQGRSPR
jgi:predicted CXXCH cytochrome family protein